MGYNTRENSKSGDSSKKIEGNKSTDKSKIVRNDDELIKLISEAVLKSVAPLVEEISLLKNEISYLRTKLEVQWNSVNDTISNCYLNISSSSAETVVESNFSFSEAVKKQKKLKNKPVVSSVFEQKRSSKAIMGFNSAAQADFASTDSRLWIYVGRCKPDVTAEQIKSYLEKQSPGYKFDVMKLISKGFNSSFRISADVSLKDVIYSRIINQCSIQIQSNITNALNCNAGSSSQINLDEAPSESDKLLQSNFSLLFLNIRSLRNKYLPLDVFLSDISPHIFCVADHGLTCDEIKLFKISNYNLINSFCRSDFCGGGVAIFASNELNVSIREIAFPIPRIEKHLEYSIAEFVIENSVDRKGKKRRQINSLYIEVEEKRGERRKNKKRSKEETGISAEGCGTAAGYPGDNGKIRNGRKRKQG
ncbi:hypothetical protein QE152_g35937 [Popillia japonica]|uniref:Uncharacterized protein n=1 Tax=Popillia japonica TaxID=7064 RepID=A0AAW1IEP9_POPJA